jgi:signal transduction histidine kinase/ActR/RegA family two-component response regulator
LSQKSVSAPFVLRYVYAILLVIVVTVATAISSLYFGQREEIRTRDRVQSFHLESATESEELAREVRMLLVLLQDSVDSNLARRSGAADIQSVHIGYRGVLYSMRSRLARLSTLQEQYDGLMFATALKRLVDRFNEVDRALDNSRVTPETIVSIEVLSSNIEQYDRLHKIAADRELRELADRLSQIPQHLAVLAVCLGFGALAVWYLTNSLRASLVRQKRTEEALAESQERLHHIQKLDALGQLVGGVAHDFNNLLTAILGHAELLEDKAAGNERIELGLNEIRKAGLQAASLTQQLLAFSRRQQFKPHILNLNDVIQDMEEMLQRIIGADVNLTCAYADELCAVEVDPDQLQQVIMNLVGNARDAMPNGGVLSVTTENVAVGAKQVGVAGVPSGEYARLTVSDSGIGMDDYTRERIFEPYFTTKEKSRGTGLGLSTVHGIVAGSNGHIFVESQEGVGSQFHVYFPRAERRPEASPDENIPIAPQSGSETILVVEDDTQIRRFVESGLSSLGYRVLTASGGAAGLEICKTEPGPIDAIVSDVIMSEVSGPRFMTSALRLRPSAVAIYMSAYTEDEVLGLRRGNTDTDIPLIMKPFDLESLSRLIRERLNKAASRTANSER